MIAILGIVAVLSSGIIIGILLASWAMGQLPAPKRRRPF